MVCPRCITAVQSIFGKLKIETVSIQLGEVITKVELDVDQKNVLEQKLLSDGFELLTDNNSKIIGQIKSIIIDKIHHSKKTSQVNFSEVLSSKINKEYSSLTKLFTSVEGQTIERFILNQKIEKVKELLFYNEFTLSEIAHQLSYSSTAHLSAQFKKETGITPTAFKKMKGEKRKGLDEI